MFQREWNDLIGGRATSSTASTFKTRRNELLPRPHGDFRRSSKPWPVELLRSLPFHMQGMTGWKSNHNRHRAVKDLRVHHKKCLRTLIDPWQKSRGDDSSGAKAQRVLDSFLAG